MGKVSSDQLFHFVDEKNYLIEILNHNFYPRLSQEPIIPFLNASLYVPMKCFCDMPIQDMDYQYSLYGPYGIAFKKAWGIQTGLTPVIYYNPESHYIKNIRSMYQKLLRLLECPAKFNLKSEAHENPGDISRKPRLNLIQEYKSALSLYKPTYGCYKRAYDCEYNFYNEREWRYLIPTSSHIPSYLYADHMTLDDQEYANEKCRCDSQIEFCIDDIDFIICQYEDEFDSILQGISELYAEQTESIRGKLYTFEALKKLYSDK